MDLNFLNEEFFGLKMSENGPVGSIIAHLGKTAPENYLICDGTVYNITDYPNLANFFKNHFGISNHFGGDGIETFAVPDMRNLFLRGYHGESEKQLSGEIGTRQEATRIPYTRLGYNQIAAASINGEWNSPENTDEIGGEQTYDSYGRTTYEYYTMPFYYTSRPVNMAVLYCIKAIDDSISLPIWYTENNWRIRKWSDGYVEFLGSFDHTVKSSDWSNWGNIYSVPFERIPTYSYPFPLSTIYFEKLDITTSSTVASINSGMRVSNDKTKYYGLVRGTKPSENINIKLNYFIAGQMDS